MSKKLSAIMTFLILIPLILTTYDGDDEPDCLEPVDPSTLPEAYELDAEASFESGLTYAYPSAWELTEVSGSVHEFDIPDAPGVFVRVVDTEQLVALGFPETVGSNESDFDAYVEEFYGEARTTNFASGTIGARQFMGGGLALSCEGEANIAMYDSVAETIVTLDVLSEAGPIPDVMDEARADINGSLQGR